MTTFFAVIGVASLTGTAFFIVVCVKTALTELRIEREIRAEQLAAFRKELALSDARAIVAKMMRV